MTEQQTNPLAEIFQAFFFLISILFGVIPMVEDEKKSGWDNDETYYPDDGQPMQDELIDF